jgi:hypothetical protein
MARPENRRVCPSADKSAAAAFALFLLVSPAQAEEQARRTDATVAARPSSPAPAPDSLRLQADWDPALLAAVLPETRGFGMPQARSAPAHEMASGLGLQVERKRRRFRQRAIGWLADKSRPAGWVSDFIIGGADSGWHLVMDPSGDDEYILEFKAKFR